MPQACHRAGVDSRPKVQCKEPQHNGVDDDRRLLLGSGNRRVSGPA